MAWLAHIICNGTVLNVITVLMNEANRGHLDTATSAGAESAANHFRKGAKLLGKAVSIAAGSHSATETDLNSSDRYDLVFVERHWSAEDHASIALTAERLGEFMGDTGNSVQAADRIGSGLLAGDDFFCR